MSHSYSSNRVHVIFSTKGRAKIISDEIQPKLWAYMGALRRNRDSMPSSLEVFKITCMFFCYYRRSCRWRKPFSS
jgi:hypothetical protein